MSDPDPMKYYRSADGYRQAMAFYDSAFLGMKASYESTFVETRHGRTHVIVSGKKSGPPVVLFHGLSANPTMWILQIEALAKTYHVYAPDTIGQMGKSAPVRLPEHGPGYGEWVADTLDGLGIKQASLIGSSNGGWLILKLAAVAPHKIKSAILMSTAGITRGSLLGRLAWRLAPKLPISPKAVEMGLKLVLPPGMTPDPTTQALSDLMMSHFRLEQIPGALTDAEMKKLTAPTALMMGQYDLGFPWKSVIERALRVLPNLVSAEVVPGTGHGMNADKPAEVNQRLLAFLQKYAV
jgi:pimeloyl-ACP methyl ester carboxylesterase